MRVAITGASGLVGSALSRLLREEGREPVALSRRPEPAALANADAVVHLAGEPVAQRWTREAKTRIRDSRVEGTRHLVQVLQSLDRKPRVLVSASAIGYYGHRGGEILSETAEPGEGFLPETSVAWEREARRAGEHGIRVVCVRIGIVLSKDGGALAKMLPPFKMGVGGRLGDGRQWMSWIHLRDLVRLMVWAIEREDVPGTLNGTAPESVTNAQFTRVLAAVLRRPALFPVPEFALKLLFGEMARVLFESQRVQPEAAQRKGFQFEFPSLEPALRDLLSQP